MPDDGLAEVSTLTELADLVAARSPLYVRYSEGPDGDARGRSLDFESGLTLPGLSVNPLSPEGWWTRPLSDWLARQLCQYEYLAKKEPERYAWALRGRVVARGPDNEPLLVDVEPVARLSDSLLREAEQQYRSNFDAGRGPTD
jgi:uncharacterized protein DUF6098